MSIRVRVRLFLALVMACAIFALAPAAIASAAYTPPPVKVGVVRSLDSQAWLRRYFPPSNWDSVIAKQDVTYNWLDSRGWDVTYLSDDDLESMSTLRQYDVVVLMWVFAMSPNAANNLRDYTGEGHGLVTLYASPRVAPDVGGGLTEDCYYYIFKTNDWEWGPLSEVVQATFLDDWGGIKFHTDPLAGHPIVTGAADILDARGIPSTDLRLVRDPAAWVELVGLFPGNTNTVQFLSMTADSAATGSSQYYGVRPGAHANEYLKGRHVYYDFSPVDFMWNQEGIGARTASSGARQDQIAGALVESSIAWAADTSGTVGPLIKDGRTHAKVTASYGGIYVTQSISNLGNVQVTGPLSFRVYDPNGVKVKDHVRYSIGIEPGGTYSYSNSYVATLKPGLYRVEVEWNTSYPSYGRHYIETVYVRRGQGSNIYTSKNAARTTGPYVADPRIERLSGTNRYRTSVAIANAAGGYPRASGTAVIVNGDAGPDALSAAALASACDAPLLLAKRDSLPAEISAWLADPSHGITEAVIVGGTGAVDDGVLGAIEGIVGEGNVTRVWGADRYETSAEVALEVKRRMGDSLDGSFIVCNGAALADAAGASAVSAGRVWPLLFVKASEIPTVVADAMSEVTSGAADPQVWVAGGTGVVLPGIEPALAAYGTLWRAAGVSRYDTAAKLADKAVATGSTWNDTGLASGVQLVDALCLGPYLGRLNAPLLLTPTGALDAAPKARFVANKAAIRRVLVGGGYGAVNDEVIAEVSRALP